MLRSSSIGVNLVKSNLIKRTVVNVVAQNTEKVEIRCDQIVYLLALSICTAEARFLSGLGIMPHHQVNHRSR